MGPGGLAEKEAKGPSQADRMISDENFHKREHILKSKDFTNAYKKGLFCKKGALVLYYTPNDSKFNRIGFSISARNVKPSHRRNRIRRLLREVYRKKKKNLKTGYDLVLVVKKGLPDTVLYKDVENPFLRLVEYARLYS